MNYLWEYNMFNLFKSKAKNITKSEIDGMFNGVWTHMKAVEQQLEEVKDELNTVKIAVNKLTYICAELSGQEIDEPS